MMDDYKNRLLECAVEYAKMGWKVLLLHTVVDGVCSCGKINCSSPGKHPVTVNGVKDATTDIGTIHRWFGNGRACNVGIAAGSDTGLVMLDIDPKNGGNISIHKYNIPETLEVATGSGGKHFYFQYPQGIQIRNSAGKLGPGLDVRADNGYVVAPPSVHASGKEYRWAIDPRAMEPSVCPEWIVGGKINTQVPKNDGPIFEGSRNNTLTSIAGAMRRQSCDTETINAALASINQRRCRPSLSYDEISRIAKSIGNYPVEEQDKIILKNDHSDTIAEAFVKAANGKYRYNCIDGWSIYTDSKYKRIEYESEVAVDIRRFLSNCYYTKYTNDSVQHVKTRPTNSKIRDILGSLSSLDGVHILPELHAPSSLTDKFKKKRIVAMNNCLLDITSDTHVPTNLSEDYYTFNYMPFDYAPQAKCPGWISFLESIFLNKHLTGQMCWDRHEGDFVEEYEQMPDKQAMLILQEWFGYFISGRTDLQKIFGLIGPRRSGKSTIGKMIHALVGTKNTTSPTLTSLSTEFGLQPLLNKTMAIIGDANISGRTGDVSRAVERLKSISGEDSQQINRKGMAHLEVNKLNVRFLIIANEMQDLRDSSGALASRFNFLITTESFLGRENLNLESNLLKELPGIFNWALEGLVRLRKRGYLLEHPASVENRSDFEAMSSPMTSFVNEWCNVGPGREVPIDAIWKAHRDWSNSNGRGDGFSKQKFATKLKSVVPGISKKRKRADLSTLADEYTVDNINGDNRIWYYLGLDLKPEYKKRVDNCGQFGQRVDNCGQFGQRVDNCGQFGQSVDNLSYGY